MVALFVVFFNIVLCGVCDCDFVEVVLFFYCFLCLFVDVCIVFFSCWD